MSATSNGIRRIRSQANQLERFQRLHRTRREATWFRPSQHCVRQTPRTNQHKGRTCRSGQSLNATPEMRKPWAGYLQLAHQPRREPHSQKQPAEAQGQRSATPLSVGYYGRPISLRSAELSEIQEEPTQPEHSISVFQPTQTSPLEWLDSIPPTSDSTPVRVHLPPRGPALFPAARS